MQDHTVTVDRTANPSSMTFAPVFNVAGPLIDRHVQEGRSQQVALRTVSGEVTYGALAEHVNRCGNVLREHGVAAGDRVLMVVKDCPEFVYLFWGAIKAGMVPVPVNTLLRAPDYQYMIEDSGCAMVVYSPEYAAEVEPALASAKAQPVAMPVEGGEERRCRVVCKAPRPAWRRRPRVPKTPVFGSTRRALPDVPKGRCTGIATLW